MLVTAEMLAHFRGSGLTLRFAWVMLLKQDACRGLVVAAAPDHLDRAMQVCLAGGELLGERKRKTGLHQHVETPAFDLRSLVLWCLGYLGHEVRSASPFPRRTLLLEVCASDYEVRNAPSRLDSAALTAVSSRRVKSSTRASSTSRSASASAPTARICDLSSASTSENLRWNSARNSSRRCSMWPTISASLRSTRAAPASETWARRSASTDCASCANWATARSSSRESRLAASSRAVLTVAENCSTAASDSRFAVRSTIRVS